MSIDRRNARDIKAPTGPELTCGSWQTEAPFRMIQNNLDREVAENPDELVVYGGIGRAARSWSDFEAILASLKTLADDETLLVQSGKPVGVFRTHADAPRVLIANSNIVPHSSLPFTIAAGEKPMPLLRTSSGNPHDLAS